MRLFVFKKFFENTDVSQFGFFRAVGKNREWGYRKNRERENLARFQGVQKKDSQIESTGLEWKERRQD